jgi:hypothetical protein
MNITVLALSVNKNMQEIVGNSSTQGMVEIEKDTGGVK